VKQLVLVVALSVSVTALFVTTAAGAPNKAGATGKSITLHLVEKDVAFNFVDNPPRQGNDAAPLMGDQFVFTSDIRTRSGAHTGIFAATCTVARGGVHGRYLCYGVYSLEGGLISGVAMTGEGNTTHVAITGGTGAYEGVTGSAMEVSRGENSPFTDLSIHLIYR
jgi:hypothetical protein